VVNKEVVKKADINYPMEGINHIFKTNEQNKTGIKKFGRFRYISNKVESAK